VASKVTFDSPNLRVIAKPGVVALDVQQDIYSDWKAETITGVGDDLSKFPPVFVESFGGNDLGGGSNAGGFYIFNNAAGWRIRPDEADHELVIDGNFYPVDPVLPIVVPTLGGFTVVVSFDRSSLSLGVSQISADLDKIAKNVAALMGGL
jgi:hypothetical protein